RLRADESRNTATSPSRTVSGHCKTTPCKHQTNDKSETNQHNFCIDSFHFDIVPTETKKKRKI
ncbi:MAG: hypothetical protein QM668_21905, partial [Agriterribacter sp.]